MRGRYLLTGAAPHWTSVTSRSRSEAIKCWSGYVLGTLSPRTVECYYYGLTKVPPGQAKGLLTSRPQEIRSFWKVLHSGSLPYGAFEGFKSLVRFLCRFRLGGWGPEWFDLVSQLPLPKVDKYASVRTGEAILHAEEEAAIVQTIADITSQTKTNPHSVTNDLLESTCILVCSYQFGLRAKQIAMLEMRNVRIWDDALESDPAVHLTFIMIKQRSSKRVFPMVRRVKREWAPLFVELFRRAEENGLSLHSAL